MLLAPSLLLYGDDKTMDLKKYVYSLDIFDLLGSDVEGVTPLSRGLFTPKKGAEEEVKRDPAREMAQLTVAAFGGQDNARKYFGTTLPVTPNDYSDLGPWREAALRSAEEAELLKQDRGITQSLGLEDVERRNLTGNPFEGNQLVKYKAPPLPSMQPIVDVERSLSSVDIPYEEGEEVATITDPTTGRGLMSPQGGSVSEAPTEDKGILDFIGSGEGTYTSSNRGTIGDDIIGSTRSTTRNGKSLNEMTIGEIQSLQDIDDPNDPNRLFAVGKYQVIPSTMDIVVNGLDLSPDQVFDAATQDKIATFLISKKRPRLGNFLAGGETSLDRAMLEMAKEFASIPVPYDVKKGSRTIKAGQSYYAEDGANKARHSIEETRNMLLAARGA